MERYGNRLSGLHCGRISSPISVASIRTDGTKMNEREKIVVASVAAIKKLANRGHDEGPAVVSEIGEQLEQIYLVIDSRTVKALGADLIAAAQGVFVDSISQPEHYIEERQMRRARLYGAVQALQHALRPFTS